MKTLRYKFLAGTLVLVATMSAQAHAPEEYSKQAEKPNCAAMKDMDHSQMDRDDPVMMAMMQQCMNAMHQNENTSDKDHADDSGAARGKDAEVPANHQH